MLLQLWCRSDKLMSSYMTPLAMKEAARVVSILGGQFIGILFDGKTHFCESFAQVARCADANLDIHVL